MDCQQEWKRDTTWRQGHVLDAGTVTSLNILHPTDPADTCAVVISHDCDLANTDLAVEPDVELIVGRVVREQNGSLAWGKSPRTLHMEVLRDGKCVAVELVTTSKKLISKASLAGFTRDPAFDLGSKGLAVLRNWLAIRYNRGAFPDPFVNRMKEKKLDSGLAKLMEFHGKIISAVYFYVDDGIENTRTNNSPYELNIVLAFDLGQDTEHAMDMAEKAEVAVEKLFFNNCFDKTTDKWSHIHLKSCVAISEDDLSVRQAKMFLQWRLEHMSLKSNDDPPVPMNLKG